MYFIHTSLLLVGCYVCCNSLCIDVGCHLLLGVVCLAILACCRCLIHCLSLTCCSVVCLLCGYYLFIVRRCLAIICLAFSIIASLLVLHRPFVGYIPIVLAQICIAKTCVGQAIIIAAHRLRTLQHHVVPFSSTRLGSQSLSSHVAVESGFIF